MSLDKISRLDTYDQIAEGDFVYATRLNSTVGFCRIIRVDGCRLTYSIGEGHVDTIVREDMASTLIFKPGESGQIQILAGEELIDTLDSACRSLTPVRSGHR